MAILVVGGSVGLAATAAVSVLSSDLPDPSTLNALTFNQPTVVYDRSGTVVLGTFQQERRRVARVRCRSQLTPPGVQPHWCRTAN